MISTSRGDFGHLLPLLEELNSDVRTEVELIFLREDEAIIQESPVALLHALTVHKASLSLPLSVDEWPEYLLEIQKTLTKSLKPSQFDVAVLLGDRLELINIAGFLRSVGIPILHIHGGETTAGAIDNDVRHAISKLASLHFVTNQEHANFVVELGEEPSRVVVTGALAVDNCIRSIQGAVRDLEAELGVSFDQESALVTFHPVTNERGDSSESLSFFEEIADVPYRLFITPPNQDPGRDKVLEAIDKLVSRSPSDTYLLPSLGLATYHHLVQKIGLVVGNSSSGVIDAPILGAQSIDYGTRQSGRFRHSTVTHVEANSGRLKRAMLEATSKARAGAAPAYEFFGFPGVAKRMVEALLRNRALLVTPKVHRRS